MSSHFSTAAHTAQGRTARTKGLSLSPTEFEDLSTLEQVAGVGLSELYHRHFAPQVAAAAEMLREVQGAGIDLTVRPPADVWDLHMSTEDLTRLYTARSELVLGE